MSYHCINAQMIPQVILPSPTASSLGQYGDIPVSNYTGIPSISIPLYLVKSGEIELPISLSYYASGIKVAEESGWVGLGWALNAGGVITRSVRGVDDLDPNYGYMKQTELPSTASNIPDFSDPNIDYYTRYRDIHSGLKDGQPDLFYYNFMGYSGKMVFERNSGSVVKGIPLNQSNMKFSYNVKNKEWTLIDGNGWKYFFGTVEYTQGYSSSDARSIRYTRLDTVDHHRAPDYLMSAWYLDKIITPKGDKIDFHYDDVERRTIGQINYSQNESHYIQNIFYSQTYNNFWYGYDSYAEHHLFASMNWINDVYLERIDFKNGYVEFTTEDKDDMRQDYFASGNNIPKPQKLTTIEVFNLSGVSTEKVDFDYSYFNGNKNVYNKENYWRLKLNSVQKSYYNELSATYQSLPPYTFTYNKKNLPAKNSANIDHWGYYNGYDNDHVLHYDVFDVSNSLVTGNPIVITQETSTNTKKYFVPHAVFKDPYVNQFSFHPFLDGAFREVHVENMQASILNRIDYPAGGASRFIYEPNDYIVADDEGGNDTPYEDIIVEISDMDAGFDIPSITTHKKEFTLSQYSRIKVTCTIDNGEYATTPTGVYDKMIAVIEKSTGEDIVSFKPEEENVLFRANIQIFLPPGNYRIVLDNDGNDDLSVRMKLNYIDRVAKNNKVGGGLRISRVETLNSLDQVVNTKVYSYNENGVSTGKSMSPIEHFYLESTIEEGTVSLLGSLHSTALVGKNIMVRSSENEMPLGTSAQGSFVGYNKVSVSDVDQAGNTLGKTVYHYTNRSNEQNVFHIPGVPNITHLDNGNLIKVEYFNNSVLQKSIETNYAKYEPSKNVIKGIATHSSIYRKVGEKIPKGYYIRFYSLFSEWWYPTGTIETIYNENGLNPFVQTSVLEYANPNHKQLTKTTQKNSENETIVTTFKYPSDSPEGTEITSATFNRMMIDNILNPVIKQETVVDGSRTINGSIYNYIIDGNNNVVLDNIQQLKTGSSVYEQRLKYHKYNSNGNPVDMSKMSGGSEDMHYVYRWGYNNQYPVAKISNYTSVQLELNTTLKTKLASLENYTVLNPSVKHALYYLNVDIRNSLPNLAQITTYTYDPLIGMTSQTDPNGRTTYYEYDDFGRLQYIKDQDANIIKKYEYKYATQTTN